MTALAHAALVAVPPSASYCEELATANTGTLMSRGEADKRRKEQVRFKTSQELVDGIKQVVAYATPVADGMKALMFGLGLTEADAVYVATFVNAHNEWEIFSGMTTSAKELYVTECLKEKKGWRFKVEDSGKEAFAVVSPPSQTLKPVQPVHPGLRLLSGVNNFWREADRQREGGRQAEREREAGIEREEEREGQAERGKQAGREREGGRQREKDGEAVGGR